MFKKLPGIDVEAFVDDAKRIIPRIGKTCIYDAGLKKLAYALKHGTSYKDAFGDTSTANMFGGFARKMGYIRRRK